MKPGFASGDLACVVKHAADMEGHCNEAISHSLATGHPDESKKWTRLRDEVRGFRQEVQAGKVQPSTGILEIRKIRAYFEGFNPAYDISKCAACGDTSPLEDLKEALGPAQPSLRDQEEALAHRVVNDLAAKYHVEPPRLVINERCHSPTAALYDNGTIHMCRGGVSAQVAAHEFEHHLQLLNGKPMDEEEAETSARRDLEKRLYVAPSAYHSNGDQKDLNTVRKLASKKVLVILASPLVGLGIIEATKKLSVTTPTIMGVNTGLLVDTLGVVGGVGAYALLPAKYNTLAEAALFVGASLIPDLLAKAGIYPPQLGLGSRGLSTMRPPIMNGPMMTSTPTILSSRVGGAIIL